MRRLRAWFFRVVGMFDKRRLERDFAEELESHLWMHAEDNIRSGMTPDEARRAALVKLGGVESTKQLYRERWGIPALESLLQDLRYGARALRKSPGFTLVAVLSLMLGVGANTAIFQVLDAVRLRTLPVKSPDELVEIRIANRHGITGRSQGWHHSLTNPLWEEIRDRQQAFSGVFAWGEDTFNLESGGEERDARGLTVSGDFFNVLGVRPALGRVFTPADDRRGSDAASAVISYAFWQREYGGAPSVIGRTLTLDGHPFDIIGVTPAGFFGLEPGRSFDVAVPLCAEPILRGEESKLDERSAWWLTVMGRLKAGVTAEQAASHLGGMSTAIFEATLPADYDAATARHYLEFKLDSVPAGTGVSKLREDYETSLWLLLTIAGLVLLIACANLANLLLARASTQEREMALRLALGASRGRLVRQLLTESLLLAAAGAFLGLLLARALSQALVSFLDTQGSPLFVDLGVDWRVFGFTAGLAVSTCVLFGVAPALRATRTTPGAALKGGGRGSTEGRERLGLRRVLVCSQVALSLVLLMGALLFARSLGNLLTLDPGFRPSGILIASVDLTRLRLPAGRRTGFKRELIERIRAIPGVAGAADTTIIPLSGSGWNDKIWMDGSDPSSMAISYFSRVGQDYFSTMGTPLFAGRDFDGHDTVESPKVAIVNEEFARRFAGGANPVGAKFWLAGSPSEPSTLYEIVGLAKNTKYRNLREGIEPIAFLPVSQDPLPDQFDQILIRSDAPPSDLLPSVKRALAEVSGDLSFECDVLETQIRATIVRERLMATLSGFFGVLAVVLATIGLYGVTSYTVARRTHEIGIRMALGAMRRDIVAMMMREVATLLTAGLAVGVAAALIAAKATSALLFGVAPNDPVMLGAAAGILAAVTAAAGFLPAYRASSVDPMAALRDE